MAPRAAGKLGLVIAVALLVACSGAAPAESSLAAALMWNDVPTHRRQLRWTSGEQAYTGVSPPPPPPAVCPEACSVFFVKHCVPAKNQMLSDPNLREQFRAHEVRSGYALCRKLVDGPWDGAASLEGNGCPLGCQNTIAMWQASLGGNVMNATQEHGHCQASSGGSSLSLDQLPLPGSPHLSCVRLWHCVFTNDVLTLFRRFSGPSRAGLLSWECRGGQ